MPNTPLVTVFYDRVSDGFQLYKMKLVYCSVIDDADKIYLLYSMKFEFDPASASRCYYYYFVFFCGHSKAFTIYYNLIILRCFYYLFIITNNYFRLISSGIRLSIIPVISIFLKQQTYRYRDCSTNNHTYVTGRIKMCNRGNRENTPRVLFGRIVVCAASHSIRER